jgi:hypothetical protein
MLANFPWSEDMNRVLVKSAVVIATVFGAVACTDYATDPGGPPSAPTNLYYQLEPSGDPDNPSGIVLHWDANQESDLARYNVYSRASSNASFDLRGSTTSTSFHDNGPPDLEYYVTAEDLDKQESQASSSIVINELLRLQSPTTLTSLSLNGAIHLSWADNAFTSNPSAFLDYRVYSASYDLDHNTCGTSWTLEGTTVSPVFLSGALPNGQPRCFGVSAVSVEGYESLWSPLRYDTPRPDSHLQVVYTTAGDPLKSGFRFFLDANNDGQVSPLELGLITSGSSGSVDFTITKDAGGNLQFTPVRANTSLRFYGTGNVTDLTDIDIAPASGYARTALLAQPGRGYVFQMSEADGFMRYGGLRVVALGPEYVIFDWSYQTDPGNPELIRAR